MHVDWGSTINLTCVSKFNPTPPSDVVWYRNDEVSLAKGGYRGSILRVFKLNLVESRLRLATWRHQCCHRTGRFHHVSFAHSEGDLKGLGHLQVFPDQREFRDHQPSCTKR